MSSAPLDFPQDRTDDCPSDLRLDMLFSAELDETVTGQLEEHVATCSCCEQRMATRRAGFDALEGFDDRAMLQRLEQEAARLDAKEPAAKQTEAEAEPGEDWLTRFAQWLFPQRLPQLAAGLSMLALLAGGVWLLSRNTGPDSLPTETSGSSSGDVVRPKGKARMRVLKRVGPDTEEIFSGARLRPGDQLRFKISTPTAGYHRIVGVEEKGEIFAAIPIKQNAPAHHVDSPGERTLSEAIELDENLGREWLHFVLCPKPFRFDELSVAKSDPSKLLIPEDCTSSSFELRKERPAR